jgi:hypothetical protein
VKKIFEYVQSFFVVGLVLAGIGGLSYNMFKEDGWLSSVLSGIWKAQLQHPMIAIPVTIAVFFIGKMWYDYKRAKGYTSKLPDMFVYVIMGAGVYFIWQFAVNGSL